MNRSRWIFLLLVLLPLHLVAARDMNTDEGHRSHRGFSGRQRSGLLPSSRPINPAAGRRRAPLRTRRPTGDSHRGHKHAQADKISDARIKELTETFKRNVLRLKTHDKLDLTFLIDESKSVGLENFLDEIKFVSRFVSGIAVDMNHTRVAVVTFADNVTSWVNQVSMGEIHAHKCSLLGHDLPSIVYVGGGTFTMGAMDRAKVIFENARSYSKKVIFLITDGYSNGGDPRPMAATLKREGIEIFTFGIKEGNKAELTEIASDPKGEHTLILNSFKEFEAVARRALHSDIGSGDFVVEDSSHCDKYCSETNCCHDIADCRCGTSNGRYECVCRPGYYGAGLKPDSCYPCPEGTYKPEAVPGRQKSCTPCPDTRMMSPEASTSLAQCTCAEGYYKFSYNGTARCEPIRCEGFYAPLNGLFLACDAKYHASCTVACDEGYDLQGTATVVCVGDGEWATTDGSPREMHFCQVRYCLPLSPPANGKITCTDTSNAYLTACDFVCDEGYKLLHGSTRICDADRHWTGTDPECHEITCPSISQPDHGQYFGVCVGSARAKYGEDCSFSCPHEGFELLVAPTVTCAETGRWHPPVTDKSGKICNDTLPPELECPNDITVNTDIRQYTADVTWEQPVAVDNSESVTLSPNLTFPVALRIGVHELTYVATDDSGLSTQCTFTVTVRDLEPPMIGNCRGPQPFVIAPGESVANHVQWKEPAFFDNSGTVRMTSNATFGSFPLGTTVVEYVATDETGNERRCTIDIFVQDNSCPRLEEPRNGHIDCRLPREDETECEMDCNSDWFGFAMFEFGKPTYVCLGTRGSWDPEATIPMDCSKQKYSREVLKDYQVMYKMETMEFCNDTNFIESVHQTFVEIFTERVPRWCSTHTGGLRCSLVSVIVKCIAVEDEHLEPDEYGPYSYGEYSDQEYRMKRSVPRRKRSLLQKIRRKRSDDDYSDDYADYATYASNAGEAYRYTSNSDGSETVPDYVLGIGEAGGAVAEPPELTVEEQMSEVVPPSVLGENDVHSHHELEVTATLRGEIDLGGVNLEEDRRKHMGMSEFIRTLDVTKEFEGRASSIRVPIINTTEFDYVTYKPDSYLTTMDEMICPLGTVFKGGAFCVNCPIGAYYDVIKADCVSCPEGFYQDKEAQLSCQPCPTGTSTVKIHTRSERECKAMCSPGFFSPNGLEPCESCPKHTYIDFYAAQACAACPEGSGTIRRASDSMDDCGELCQPGYVSNDGFTPCLPCPFHSYQFSPGQSFCYGCPQNTKTDDQGSSSYAQCEGFDDLLFAVDEDSRNITEEDVLGLGWELDHLYYSDCFSDPCQNDANCKGHGSGFMCICVAGYAGETCEINIDDCASHACAETATCLDLVNGFQCNCATGYEGELCDIEIDECEVLPCLNGATCVDLLAGFRCDCATGFTGTLCDIDIDECESYPCKNGGQCVDDVAGFHCTCAVGFEGVVCQTNIDDCASDPCFNDAACEDGVDNFACLCRDGFRGILCDENIDECASDPCDNGGTCLDLVNEYKCLCPPTYVGVHCEEMGDPYFDLVFGSPNTYHHIKMEYALTNLTEFTISFLMKSDYKDNYGTPFSYAVGDGVKADTLTLTDLTALTLYINGKFEVSDSRPLNDGKWYLVTVVWMSEGGNWAIFLNGVLEDRGKGLATNETIPGGGVFVIGQEQDSLGGNFSSSQEFLGTISQFNVYDYAFTAREVLLLWRNCADNQGNVRAWPDFKGGIFGVEERDTDFCLPCPEAESGVGHTVTNMNEYTVKLTCAIGHEMRHSGDDGEFRCGRDATWKVKGTDVEPELITCTKISCAPLDEIEMATLVVTGAHYEDVATYSCEVGYEIQGNGTRTCQADETWSGETPSCADVDECADASTCHKNANCTNFIGGFSCQCKYGFKGDGHECQEIYCAGAGSLQFGAIVGNNFKLGGIVRYSCDYGYRLEGAAERTCLENDSWSGEMPTCVKVECVEPEDVAHASKTPEVATRSYRSQVHYQCEPGYYMVGDDMRECGPDSEWTGLLPSCNRVSCTQPPQVTNAITIKNGGIKFNDVVHYLCEEGFSLLGDSELRCNASKMWEAPNGQYPVCEHPPCDEPPATINGKYRMSKAGTFTVTKAIYTFETEVEYECNVGYNMDGTSTLTCQADGIWDAMRPECQIVSCGQPPVVGNAELDVKGVLYGDIVNYVCQSGYVMMGEPALTCLASGYWIDEDSDPAILTPVCNPKNCGAPAKVPNSAQELSGADAHVFKAVVKFKCEKGYTPSGFDTIECGTDGVWLPEQNFHCELVTCEPPAEVEHGSAIRIKPANAEVYEYLHTISYLCEAGFRMLGEADSECTEYGTWSVASPTCQPVECSLPERVANSSIIFIPGPFSEDAVYQSRLEYSCDVGFYLASGDTTRVCTEEGVWTGVAPACGRVACGPPPLIQHAMMRTITLSPDPTLILYRDQIEYNCELGFVMTGGNIVQCTSNATFTALPECDPVSCGEPPEVTYSNSVHDGLFGDNVFGSIVTYTCEPDFKMVGSPEITCMDDGEWKIDTPTGCEPITCEELDPIPNAFRFVSASEDDVTYPGLYGKGIHPPRVAAITACAKGYEIFETVGELRMASDNGDSEIVRTINPQAIESLSTDNQERMKKILKQFTDDRPAALMFDAANMKSSPKPTTMFIQKCSGVEKVGWLRAAPECKPMLCQVPHELENGHFVNGEQANQRPMFGTEIQYQCEYGYEFLEQHDSVTCDWSDDIWDVYLTALPQCLPLPCPDPPIVPHSTFAATSGKTEAFKFQDVLHYACDEGYEMVGTQEIQCEATSSWSSPPPSCPPIECPEPIPLKNGRLSGRKRKFQSVISFSCDKGHSLNGQPNITCLSDRSWSSDFPTCDPVPCGSPPEVDHANVVSTSEAYGGCAVYSCKHGFYLNGYSKIRCMASGTWEENLPTCTYMICPPPPATEHVVYENSVLSYSSSGTESPRYIYDDVITYSCEEGYETTSTDDDLSVLCLTGENIPSIPSCEGGNEFISDVPSGFWSNSPPVCNPKDCGPPPDPHTHGILSVDETTFNHTVHYSCHRGYYTSELDVIATCLANGQWSKNSAPNCLPFDCGQPDSVENGASNGSVFTYQSVVEFSCNEGYDLIGVSEITCQATGTWDDEPPICEPVDCGRLPRITNGKLIFEATTLGEEAIYSCASGYILHGTAVFECLKTGTWSHHMPPACQPVDCGKLIGPEDGAVNATGHVFQRIGTYSCHPGHNLIGESETECLATGNWSSVAPVCEPVDCREPTAIENAALEDGGSNTFQSMREYVCDNGYEPTGKMAVTCMESAEWSDLPSCRRVKCDPPLPPDNGEISVDEQLVYEYEDEITYACYQGYIAKGDVTSTCSAKRTWTNAPPTCEPVDCGSAPSVIHSHKKGSKTTFMSVITYSCRRGYEMAGNASIECLHTGEWHPAPPVCTEVSCGKPQHLKHGTVGGGDSPLNWIFESHITYSCDIGYHLHGASGAECSPDGLWVLDYNYYDYDTDEVEETRHHPFCEVIQCQIPPAVGHGSYKHKNYTYGDIVTYACDEGYDILSTEFVVCTGDENAAQGHYIGKPPECHAVPCGVPKSIDHGSVTYFEDVFQSIATYDCEEGYNLIGSETAECMSTRRWSSRPVCDPKDCGLPILPEFANVIVTSTLYPSIIHAACEEGYVLGGASSIECTTAGEWSSETFHCEPVSCGEPPEIENGYFNASGQIFKSKVVYKCMLGYLLHPRGSNETVDAMTITCQSDAEWQDIVPACQPVECGTPPEIENGQRSSPADSLFYQDTVGYDCDKGYYMSGLHVLECGPTGKFSSAPPRCLPVSCNVPPSVRNSVNVPTGLTYRHEAVYTCSYGYVLSVEEFLGETFSLTCNADGVWSPTLPEEGCVPYNCGPPLIVPNALVPQYTPNTTFGEMFMYQCEDGYEAVEETLTVTCMRYGEWSKGPDCRAVDCGPVICPEKAICDGTDTTFMNIARVTCVAGHEFQPGVSVYDVECLANAQWSIPPLAVPGTECVRISCGPPPVIPYGYSTSTFPIGEADLFESYVTYHCNPGYDLVGPAETATCHADGAWRPWPFPGCIPKDCGEPPPCIDRADCTLESTTYESVYTVTCNMGYELERDIPTTELECMENGEWEPLDPELFACLPIQCEALPAIKKGRALIEHIEHDGPKPRYLETVEYECDPGYYIAGMHNTVTCLENKTYSEPPKCLPVSCGSLSEIDNGNVASSDQTYQNTATYNCESGYILEGFRHWVCSKDSVWVPDTSEDEPLSRSAKMVHRGSEQLTQIQAMLSESSGMVSEPGSGMHSPVSPVPKESKVIQEVHLRGAEPDVGSGFKRAWSVDWKLDQTPLCRPVSCGPPPFVRNSEPVSPEVHVYQQSVTYQCQSGFELHGNDTVTCQANGHFGPNQPPICVRVQCDVPDVAENCEIIGVFPFTFENSLIYRPLLGFEFSPFTEATSFTMTCGADRKSDITELPGCIPVSCGMPPVPAHGSFSLTQDAEHDRYGPYTYRQKAIFSCDEGYELDGPAVVACLANREWSPKPPGCNPVSCGEPPQILLGMYTVGVGAVDPFTFGQVVKYHCDEGYKFDGQNGENVFAITCQDDRMWDGSPPKCTPVPCPSLQEVENGEYLLSGSPVYGATASFNCAPGHEMEGEAFLTCQASGEWSSSAPTCNPVSCSTPPRVKNSNQLAMPSLTYGQSVTYNCLPGYDLSGPRTLTCQEDQTFGNPAPVCKPIHCNPPSQLENGRYTKDAGGFVFKSSVIFRCNDGYRMISEDEDRQFKSITCEADRSWSGGLPTCEIISCGEPESLMNGYMDGAMHTYMSMIAYSCEPGYRIHGNSTQYGYCLDTYVCRVCQANEIWGTGSSDIEPEHPLCLPVSCGEPPELANARSETDSHVFEGTTVYTCDPGYEFPPNPETGNSPAQYNLSCWSNAMWGPLPVPECQRKMCDTPAEIENGYFLHTHRTLPETQKDVFVFGDMVTYHCDHGYNPSGFINMTCGPDKLWDVDPPVCVPVSCGPPPSRENGYMAVADNVLETTFKSVVVYICDVGHEYTGEEVDNMLMCTADGIWSQTQPPPCTPVDCGTPTDLSHGSFELDEFRTFYLGVVRYTCDEGYRLSGESAQICQANKKWSGPAPSCEPAPCPNPPIIPNGFPEVTKLTEESPPLQYVYKNKVKYACDVGYKMETAMEFSECNANGTWDVHPECGLVTCEPLPPSENSKREGVIFSFKKKVLYSCDNGYSLEDGASAIECLCGADGHFAPVSEAYSADNCKKFLPPCVRVSCGSPPGIIHGVITNKEKEFYYEDKVSYRCEEGHILRGNSEITCNANKQFDHFLPFCIRVSCDTPPPVDNAIIIIHNGTKYEDVVSYECHPGYLPTGDATRRKCLASGEWSDQCVRCDPINCTDVEEPLNGWISSADNVAFGSAVTFRCNEGFELVGSEIIVCESSGNWSSAVPVCERILCDTLPNVDNAVPFGVLMEPRYGAVIDFKCLDGHILNGQSTIACLSNGTWTAPPSCDPVKCRELIPVDNAVIENAQHGAFTYGQLVSYACNPGYQLATDEHTRTCQADGSFSEASISCELISCPPPPVVKYGSPSASWAVSGQNVTYLCDDGYRMVGFAMIRCGTHGSWTDPPPLCAPVSCGSAPDVKNADVVGEEMPDYVYGDIVEYVCHQGYEHGSGNSKECMASKAFSDDDVVCLPVDCGEFPKIENAIVSIEGTTFASEGTLSCEQGYLLSSGEDEKSLRCQDDKMWSVNASQIFCLPIPCLKTLNLNNGHAEITHSEANKLLSGEHEPDEEHSHVFGAEIVFTCNDGYILEGPSAATCGDDGEWSDSAPTCIPVTCGNPPNLENALPIESSLTYGMVAEYQCVEGHKFFTEATSRMCLSDGTFGEEEIVCTPVPCPSIPPTEHGTVAREHGYYGDVNSYICDVGYESSSVVTCLKMGRWSSTLPPCEPISCGTAPSFKNTSVKSDGDFVFGTIAEYSCDAGYALPNGLTQFIIACTSDGLFTEPELACEQITCDLDHPDFFNKHLLHTRGVAVAGDLVSVDCEEGYTPFGDQEVYCTETGDWLFSDVACVIVDCGLAPKVPNATPVLDEDHVYVYQGTVKYTCKPGYRLADPEGVILCQADGTFTDTLVFCDAIMCQDASVMKHGSKSSSVAAFGQKIVITCDTGYELPSGGQEVSATCQSDGEWSQDILFIQCQPIECEPLADLQFGTILLDNAVMNEHGVIVYNSTIRYKCSRGYTLKGVAKHSCLPDGSWTGTLPRCVPVQCGSPPFLPHGSISGDGMWTYGSEITYQCDLGYDLTPEKSVRRTCNEMGSWTGEHPTCSIVSCGRPDPVLFGSIAVYSTTYGSRIEIVCDDGYNQTAGDVERVCQADGTYSGEAPVCERITCGVHDDIEHGTVEPRETAYYGDQVQITCEDGFELFGDDIRSCEGEGEWTGVPPQCVAIVAGPAPLRFKSLQIPCRPPPPMNSTKVKLVEGIDIKEEYQEGDEVEYCCANGYVPTSAMKRTCHGGAWMGEPTCIPICRHKCRNRGRCGAKDRCTCTHGWSGSRCHEPVCTLPCLNGGFCTQPFLCACKLGWSGSRCQKPVCFKPCQNGGRCISPNACYCPYGYSGSDCSQKPYFSLW